MALTYADLAWGCAGGAQHKGEVLLGDSDAAGWTPTLNAPASVPTGYELGDVVFTLTGSGSGTGPQIISSTSKRVVVASWIRPRVDRSAGEIGLWGLDDGALNGMHWEWIAFKFLRVRNYSGTSIFTSSVTFGTSDSYLGNTNPHGFIVTVRDKTGANTEWEFYIYKWNGGTSGDANADFDLVESGTATQTCGNAVFIQWGATLSGGTGEMDVEPIWALDNVTAGQHGPIAPSATSAFPVSKTQNATQWVRNDAADDATTGTGDTEYPYIDEAPPVDSSGNYLKIITGNANTFRQRYGIETGKVPSGANVFGVCVKWRQYTVAGGTAPSVAAEFRLGTGTTVPGVNQAPSVRDKWTYDVWVASRYTAGTTPFADGSTDTDNIQISHTCTRVTASPETRCSQHFATFFYGANDVQAPRGRNQAFIM